MNFPRAIDHARNAPQRQIDLCCQFSQFMALAGWRGKQQFVIVATGQLTAACQQGFGTRRQQGKLRLENFGIKARTSGQVAEVGKQSVRDINGGMGQLPVQQGQARSKARAASSKRPMAL